MNEESSPSEIFEITDFTTASDWERFINDLEEIIRQWNLASGQFTSGRHKLKPKELSTGTWGEKIEGLRFAKVHFVAIHYYLKTSTDGSEDEANPSPPLMDMMNVDGDFPCEAPVISRFYGLREFILIAPSANKSDVISSEDKIKLLISSASIALNNTLSEIPIFIQINQKSCRLFQGIFSSVDTKINYDMIYLKEIPGKYSYLSELLDMFKGKLGYSSTDCPSVNVSIRFTKILKKFPEDALFYDDPISGDDPPVDVSRMIDFVSYDDPLTEIQLCHSWKSLSEELISDSPFHSDLNPHDAPFWSVRIITKDNFNSSMNDLLCRFYQLSIGSSKDQQILGQLMVEIEEKDSESEVKQALDRLSNPSLSLNIPQLVKSRPVVPQNVVSSLLGYIFEPQNDADSQSPDAKKMRKILDESGFVLSDFKSFKSAPFDSICWRIIHVISFINSSFKDVLIVAIFWKEIINELRRLWESSTILPGMENDGPPDQTTCLFNQKIQMLNCCIKQKIKYEQMVSHQKNYDQKGSSSSFEIHKKSPDVDPFEDPDEFFDAEEELTTGETSDELKSESVESEIHVKQPEGRLEPYKDLKLLKAPHERLYIPKTQEPTPMTDDMLQEQSEIMSQLGSSAEGSALRLKMQIPTLISDMESFKAANPGAILEDFVRWYSPRDYEESPQDSLTGIVTSDHRTGGTLSARMKSDNNVWIQTWNSVKSVPCDKQKKLFDYTKEAEKVLHYLTSFTLNHMVVHFMPVLIHSAVSVLIRERDYVLELNDGDVTIDHKLMARLSRAITSLLPASLVTNGERCLGVIQKIEKQLLVMKSLRRKLKMSHDVEFLSMDDEEIQNSDGPRYLFNWDDVKKFILKLSTSPDVDLNGPDDYYSKLLIRLFKMSQKELMEDQLSVGERSGHYSSQDDVSSDAHSDYIKRKMAHDCDPLKEPSAKEFILRVNVPRPASYSKSLPHRMYCLLTPHEFRIAGAFSQDILFF